MEKKPTPNSVFVAGLEEPKIDGKAYLKIILNMIWFVTHYDIKVKRGCDTILQV